MTSIILTTYQFFKNSLAYTIRTFLNIKGFSQMITSYNKIQKLLPANPRQNFQISNIELQKLHNLLIFLGDIKGYIFQLHRVFILIFCKPSVMLNASF